MSKKIVKEEVEVPEILIPETMEILCNNKSNISLRGNVSPFPPISAQDDKVTGIIIRNKN